LSWYHHQVGEAAIAETMKTTRAAARPSQSWSLPYIDQPVDFWRRIKDRFGPAVESVYFPMPGHIIGSGRPQLPSRHLQAFLESGVMERTLLLNPSVLVHPLRQIQRKLLQSLKELHESIGLTEIIVTNVKLAQLLRPAFPDVEIVASVLMDVGSPAQILYLGNSFDALVPSGRVMRDMRALRALKKAFPGRIRFMVNETCLPECVMRNQHTYETAVSQNFSRYCNEVIRARPWMALLVNMVLPEHLHLYDEIADGYKLVGRNSLRNPQDYMHVLTAYVERTPIPWDKLEDYSPTSTFDDLEITEEFFKRTLFCSRNCTECEYCREYYEQARSRRA
jgi:hypothetical protein